MRTDTEILARMRENGSELTEAERVELSRYLSSHPDGALAQDDASLAARLRGLLSRRRATPHHLETDYQIKVCMWVIEGGPAAATATWTPMAQGAPPDHELVLLLMRQTYADVSCCPTENELLYRTIGHRDEDGGWHVAGWNWENDYWTRGSGTPLAWAPLPQVPHALRALAESGSAGGQPEPPPQPSTSGTPSGAMPAATLRALRASVEKWEGIVAGTRADQGHRDCALCRKFFGDGCLGCPVREHTGEGFCVGSPYQVWGGLLKREKEEESGRFRDGEGSEGVQWTAHSPELMEAAREELEFLRSLLPREDDT